MLSPRPAYLQVSVALPPGLMEGLLENYTTVTGKRATFSGMSLYALNELHYDLVEAEELAEAGITLPPYDPSYTISIAKPDRRAVSGFYSMKIPEDFRETWWELLRAHGDNGPAAVHRALLSLYRSVRDYHVENAPGSTFLTKYPAL